MTAQEAATELGITKRTVLQHIQLGHLEATEKTDPFGRPYMSITKAALKKFMHPDGPESSRPGPGNPTFVASPNPEEK